MNSYITFKVIKIIDEYSLVINSGLKDGISIGDSIEIFLEGDEIVDPFNEGKVLRTLDFIKDTLEVTEVYSEFAVCKKIITNEVHILPLFRRRFHSMSGLSGITGTTETRITVKKLK